MLNCPRRTIGWSSCPVIRSQRRICCSCFDSCRSNFLLNRRRKSKPGTIAKSRERSPPVVPTFGAVSQGFQYLGVTQPPSVGEVGLKRNGAVDFSWHRQSCAPLASLTEPHFGRGQ